jgi:cell division protein FtsL
MLQDDRNKSKHRFTTIEKFAVAIIVILILVILLLVFNKQLREYYEMFRVWYENA